MYGTEISQMLFVLGEPQASSEDVVRFIEDIVRSQILESVRLSSLHLASVAGLYIRARS